MVVKIGIIGRDAAQITNVGLSRDRTMALVILRDLLSLTNS